MSAPDKATRSSRTMATITAAARTTSPYDASLDDGFARANEQRDQTAREDSRPRGRSRTLSRLSPGGSDEISDDGGFGAWALRRGGMQARDIARRTVACFVLKSAVNYEGRLCVRCAIPESPDLRPPGSGPGATHCRSLSAARQSLRTTPQSQVVRLDDTEARRNCSPVGVRVLFGALREAPHRGAFRVQRSCERRRAAFGRG